MRALPTIAAITLLAACTDPRFDVEITYDPLLAAAIDAADAEAKLENNPGKRIRIQVSVIDAVAAADHVDVVATCADFAFGRINASVIDGARRASASGDDGTHISGVPRLGPKLVIVEARNSAGRRFGAGCEAIDDITDDELVGVQVHVAPSVLVFDRMENTDIAPVTLVAVAPWNPTLWISGNRVITELHSGGPTVSDAEAEEPPVFGDNGQYTTPRLSLPEPTPEGPALTLVRVEWAEDAIRLPAFVPWKVVQTTTGNRITAGPDATPAFDRAWTTPAKSAVQGTYRIIAVGVEQPAVNLERVVVVRYDTVGKRLESTTVDAPGVRSVAFFDGAGAVNGLFTVLDGGWRRVAPGGLVAVAGTAVGTGAASQVIFVRDCDGDGDRGQPGLLVRRTIGAADAYRAYVEPGVLADAENGAQLLAVATALNASGQQVVGSDCVTLNDGDDGTNEQVVLSRGGDIGLKALIVSNAKPALLPNVVAAATFEQMTDQGTRWRVAGVEPTITGPRVSSYTLSELTMPGGATLTGFASDQRIDFPLATAPTSIDVFNFDNDDDNTLDVVAALPTLLGPRLQVSLGTLVNGEPLSGVSATLPGGRQATNAVVRLQDVDGVGRRELLVLTDVGVDVFCLDAVMPAEGARCAALPD